MSSQNSTPKFLGPCACLGPMYGDPYCHCEMVARGLEPSPIPKEEADALKAALERLSQPQEGIEPGKAK